MSEINYIRGDATAPSAKGVKLIAGPSLRPRTAPGTDRAADDFGLGGVQYVQVEPYVSMANMVGRV